MKGVIDVTKLPVFNKGRRRRNRGPLSWKDGSGLLGPNSRELGS